MIVLIPKPLTSADFAPFGEVIEADGEGRPREVASVFDRSAEAATRSFSVVRFETARPGPIRIERLERHPFSAQTFLPLRGGTSLVVVSEAHPAGGPDIAKVRAFVASSHQGVTYGRGVWHASVTPLEGPSEYVVLMAKTGRDDDNDFAALDEAVSVELPL